MTEPLDLVSERLDDFLRSPEANILCMRGLWGTGKTHLWRERYAATTAEGKLARSGYAYVSLFGINSIEGLRQAVIENLRFVEGANEQTLDQVADALSRGKQLANKAYGKVAPFLQIAVSGLGSKGGVGLLGGLTQAASYTFVRSILVCVDDIERRGSGLSLKDVFGFVSFLKEERDCKVALLLNDDQLESARLEFEQAVEKTVDISVTFLSSPTRACSIAFGPDMSRQQDMLSARCKELGIVNIRVLRRTSGILDLLWPNLEHLHTDVQNTGISSLAILAWSYFKAERAPSIEFVKNIESYHFRKYLPDEERPADNDVYRDWAVTLESVGWSTFDEFDEVILRVMALGFYEADRHDGILRERNEQALRSSKQLELREAWSDFRNNLAADEKALIENVHNALITVMNSVSLSSLASALALFDHAGRADLVDECLALFENTRTLNREDRHFLNMELAKPELRTRIEGIIAKMAENAAKPGSFEHELGELPNHETTERTRFLASVSVSDFAAVFRNLRGDKLAEVVKACLRNRNLINPEVEQRQLVDKATEALLQIADQSPLRALQVKQLTGLSRGEP